MINAGSRSKQYTYGCIYKCKTGKGYICNDITEFGKCEASVGNYRT